MTSSNQIKEGFTIKGSFTSYANNPDKILINLNNTKVSPDSLRCTNQTCTWEYTIPKLNDQNSLSFIAYDKSGLSDGVSLDVSINETSDKKQDNTEQKNEETKEDNKEKLEEKKQENTSSEEQIYTSLLTQIISLLQQILSWYN